jgi:hypothetical protein
MYRIINEIYEEKSMDMIQMQNDNDDKMMMMMMN